MASDDYFKIVYLILSELYNAMKKGRDVDFKSISKEYFDIPESYLLEIWASILGKGYTKGYSVREVGKNVYISGVQNAKITMDGVEYLENNSTMKRMYETLKEAKGWIPGL